MFRIRLYFIVIFLNFLTTSKSQTIISNSLFRNLYLGIDNPISLTNLNIPNSRLNVSTDFGDIKKIDNTNYIWRICSTNNDFVYLKVFSGQTLVDSIRFKVVQTPNPVLMTCIQDDEIMFNTCVGIRVDMSNFILEDIKCKIEKFVISITKSNGDTFKFENVGPYYQSAVFKDLKIGDRITLYDFEVTVGCETKPRKLTQRLISVFSGKKYEVRY